MTKPVLSNSEAVACLKLDKLVIVPTETVYGLAANALSLQAIKNIFIAKGRPQDNPLIVHLSSFEDVYTYAIDIPAYVATLAKHFCPGPLSFVLKKKDLIPDIVTAGLATAAFRIPNSKQFTSLIDLAGFPLAAPSANLSSRPSATSYNDAISEFSNSNLVCGGIDGGYSEIGIESTVIKCEPDKISILRYGNITANQISEIVDINVIHTKKDQKIESPGMKYRHYSPNINVILVKDFSNLNPDDNIFAAYNSSKYLSISENNLYSTFRFAEKENKDLVVLLSDELIENKALFDRISRASKK